VKKDSFQGSSLITSAASLAESSHTESNGLAKHHQQIQSSIAFTALLWRALMEMSLQHQVSNMKFSGDCLSQAYL